MRHIRPCLAFAGCMSVPSAFHRQHRNIVIEEDEPIHLLDDLSHGDGTFWDHRGVAFAKVNLSLDIDPSSRVSDSLLSIHSVMHKILWGDHISIKLLRDVDADLLSKHYDTTPQGDVLLLLDETSDRDKHASSRSGETDVAFPFDESNLIAKTLDKARRGNESYLVLTRKRIPAGTGLGGGTADGAYVLKSLGSMLPPEESLSIGSDFAFLQSSDSIALVSGRGDKVAPLPPLNYTAPLYILIPDEVCNTADIFKRARELMQQGRMEYKSYSMERAIIELAQFDNFRPHNSLESCIDNGVVKSLLSTLADNLGQHQYGMSGSGSACFAIGVDDIDVLRVREVFGRPLKIAKTRLMQPGDTRCEFSYL